MRLSPCPVRSAICANTRLVGAHISRSLIVVSSSSVTPADSNRDPLNAPETSPRASGVHGPRGPVSCAARAAQVRSRSVFALRPPRDDRVGAADRPHDLVSFEKEAHPAQRLPLARVPRNDPPDREPSGRSSSARAATHRRSRRAAPQTVRSDCLRETPNVTAQGSARRVAILRRLSSSGYHRAASPFFRARVPLRQLRRRPRLDRHHRRIDHRRFACG